MKSYGSYLDGKWVSTEDTFEVVNPATAEAFARVSRINNGQLKGALNAAEAALPAWRAMTAKDRGALLHRVADELLRRKSEIARTITLENGKPLAQSEGEVAMSIDHLQWFAEEARRVYGRTIPHQVNGKRHLVVKTPIGTVGAIAPWNFPLVLSVRKVAPALAAGCTVILKPATQTPLCAVALAECMEAAGVPAGVFQLAIGNAAMISREFLTNPICRKISFTGSTQVGQELIRGAAAAIKPLSLELGGLAPVLVFDDCDLDRAIEQTIIAKFRNTGQSCIAANRIYVQKTIHKEFVDRFVAATNRLKTGPGLEPGMDVGPVVNQSALDMALGQIEDAVQKGARVVTGGHRLKDSSGFFLAPTVLNGVTDDAECMSEETFAPIAPIASFDTEEEAIRRANDSCYGLSAYAMTRDIGRIFRLSEQIEAGTLGINDGAPSTSQSPFGGVKQSGWGRELGSEGLEAFLETKHVSIGGV
ncbi:glutarate-semialdehyde dehydrogenase DavD [Edaphobacter acidisoli]|uniref:Glutarate-semialdehyde dehydrogenase DavD n=1 Tax=Edaphobacter acidisoli TaxID=2040573 RepID=A0A916VZ37_9BACT|nr:NAD-dependent succinate-semialdehyde dehydrogenase [Edaphobacter acidisoli]GGA53594.1 glutarate-semialdehyde dehydrogenase DavD [Edaphobacter acidisoli]